MSGARQQFELIRDDPPPQAQPGPAQAQQATPMDPATQAAGTKILMLALRALSARTVVAISNLFTMLLVASVAALAFHVLDAPSDRQMITVAGYAVFCLAVEVIRRTRKVG